MLLPKICGIIVSRYSKIKSKSNPQSFYCREQLVEMTRELTELLRKNRTIDWQKKETGQGNWVDSPWIGIFDKSITTSATKGIYIV